MLLHCAALCHFFTVEPLFGDVLLVVSLLPVLLPAVFMAIIHHKCLKQISKAMIIHNKRLKQTNKAMIIHYKHLKQISEAMVIHYKYLDK